MDFLKISNVTKYVFRNQAWNMIIRSTCGPEVFLCGPNWIQNLKKNRYFDHFSSVFVTLWPKLWEKYWFAAQRPTKLDSHPTLHNFQKVSKKSYFEYLPKNSKNNVNWKLKWLLNQTNLDLFIKKKILIFIIRCFEYQRRFFEKPEKTFNGI